MGTLTIKDIAKICGVSTSTVSRAMNDDSGINRETKARILATIKEYNFVPNNSARNLKMLDTNTIALLIKGIDNQFFQGMIHDFEEELNKLEYSFMIHAVGAEQDEVSVAAELIKERKLKGIIFLGGEMANSKKILKPIGIPYVRCTGATDATTGERRGGSSISIDDTKEAEKAVEYLINKGHKRIAIFTSEPTDASVGYLRLEGYKRALEKHGIPFDPELICYSKVAERAYSMENGYNLAKEFFAKGIECTAIFAVSDNMCFGIYKAIFENGKTVPDDYSVIGFDGIESTKYFHPALTTIEQPATAMIKASIDQLMKAINEEQTESLIIYEGNLIERESVKDIN